MEVLKLSRQAFLTLRGMVNYRPDVLDGFRLPQGIEEEHFKNLLVMECDEFELLYPQPDVLKSFILWWSSSNLKIWEKLLETESYEYDPIENYNRKEEWEDRADSESSKNRKVTDDLNVTETVTSEADSSGDGDSSTSSPGFNVDSGMVTTSEQTTTTTSNATSKTDTEKVDQRTTAENTGDTQNTVSRHIGNVHGNVGVTTTQEMIEAQRRVVLFNTEMYIIQSFKSRFCLRIY